MTTEATIDYYPQVTDERPELHLVPEQPEVSIELIPDQFTTSRAVFERYLATRELSNAETKVAGAELHAIQESVRNWIDQNDVLSGAAEYDNYDRTRVDNKIGGLINFLRQNHSETVLECELQTTEMFIDSTFAMYDARNEDSMVAHDADGSFAFVVPARVSRNSTEYGQEVEPVIPALRYVPNELRATMMVGLPPFVIDRYQIDDQGKRGYLIFAPVFGDLMEDYGANIPEALRVARQNVNDSVDFAQQRFGVEVVGLGATLPALTRFGKSITNKNVITTTGHGGTVQLIKKAVCAGIERGYVGDGNFSTDELTIGVLGLGSIGASIAELMSFEFPTAKITVHDTDSQKTEKTHGLLSNRYGARVTASNEVSELIGTSNVVVSAVTSKIDLSGTFDLSGKLIVDDSQPGAFAPAEVEGLGGRVVWPLGRSENNVRRENYDYGTLNDASYDLFGCEAEAAILARYAEELRTRGMDNVTTQRIVGKVALQGPVNPQNARLIGALFKKHQVEAAPLQVFGTLTTPPAAL